MNVAQKVGIGVTVLAEFVGTIFIFAAIYYGALYVLEQSNPGRHEYLFGVGVGLIYGASAFLLASVLAGSLRRHLSHVAFRWLCWPGLAVGGAVFLVYLASLLRS